VQDARRHVEAMLGFEVYAHPRAPGPARAGSRRRGGRRGPGRARAPRMKPCRAARGAQARPLAAAAVAPVCAWS
jgi:hypothetical protein